MFRSRTGTKNREEKKNRTKRPRVWRQETKKLGVLTTLQREAHTYAALVHSQDTFQKVVLKRAAKDLKLTNKRRPRWLPGSTSHRVTQVVVG